MNKVNDLREGDFVFINGESSENPRLRGIGKKYGRVATAAKGYSLMIEIPGEKEPVFIPPWYITKISSDEFCTAVRKLYMDLRTYSDWLGVDKEPL